MKWGQHPDGSWELRLDGVLYACVWKYQSSDPRFDGKWAGVSAAHAEAVYTETLNECKELMIAQMVARRMEVGS